MKRLVIKPVGWPCTLKECPPGLFVQGGALGIKIADGWQGKSGKREISAYYGDTGGGVLSGTYSMQLEVQPAVAEWEEDEA